IRGTCHYFGRDEAEAMTEWERVGSYLLAGLTPPDPDADKQPQPERPTVGEVAEYFLNAKRVLMESGEVTPEAHAGYRAATDRLVDFFGKRRAVEELTAQDFRELRAKLSKGKSPATLKGHVLAIRMVFNLAYDDGQIVAKPRYGQGFGIPEKSV